MFESSPEQLDGVAREEDTDRMTGMPTGETTKRMLAKFQHIQAEANQAAQNVHVPKKVFVVLLLANLCACHTICLFRYDISVSGLTGSPLDRFICQPDVFSSLSQ